MSMVKKALTATIRVVPSPESVLHTTTILAKLATYGPVTRFTKLSSTHRSTDYEVCYSQEDGLQSARSALAQKTVNIDYLSQHPDPDQLDFFNVFGYRERQYPQPKSFQCTISDGTEMALQTEQPRVPSARVQKSKTEFLYRSLYLGHVPANLRHGLSLPPDFRSKGAVSESPEAIISTRPPLRPMDLYREVLEQQQQQRSRGEEERKNADAEAIPTQPPQPNRLFEDKGDGQTPKPARRAEGQDRPGPPLDAMPLSFTQIGPIANASNDSASPNWLFDDEASPRDDKDNSKSSNQPTQAGNGSAAGREPFGTPSRSD